MPIALRSQNTTEKREKEEFFDEKELQKLIFDCPYLVRNGDEPNIYSVQREVSLKNAGFLDILLLDDEGYPIAVEVKLSRNGESRREVAAQAFDYISDLSQLTIDELDERVGGALEELIEKIQEEGCRQDVRKNCATNLRAGMVKMVIAVDEANEGLIRIVQYINDHSDLDVRLVAINKFDNGKIHVPNILVYGSQNQEKTVIKKDSNTNAFFQSVIDAYNTLAPEDLSRATGRSTSFRQIRQDGLGGIIHYEFIYYSRTKEVGVELHLEPERDNEGHEKVRDSIRPFLAKYEGKKVGQRNIEYSEEWFSRRGCRLIIKIQTDNTSPEDCAKAMIDFINYTKDDISREYQSIHSTDASKSAPEDA
jgi:uncharacterized small protein (DUF1192 family)